MDAFDVWSTTGQVGLENKGDETFYGKSVVLHPRTRTVYNERMEINRCAATVIIITVTGF